MALVESIREIERIIWSDVMDILGFDKRAEVPKVRIGWQENGSAGIKMSDNVVFFTVTEGSVGDITQPIDEVLVEQEDAFLLRQGMTRVLNIKFVAYGNCSYMALLKIKRRFFSGRSALKKHRLYPIPDTEPIQRVPEMFQGRWWERADMSLNMNWLVIFEDKINSIESAEITIKANEPLDSDVVNDQKADVDKDTFGIFLRVNK